MPGGLTRVASVARVARRVDAARRRQQGHLGAARDGPVSAITLLRPPGAPVELTRGGSELPSRVADNLFWLGRYVERAEGTARLLRGDPRAARRRGERAARRRSCRRCCDALAAYAGLEDGVDGRPRRGRHARARGARLPRRARRRRRVRRSARRSRVARSGSASIVARPDLARHLARAEPARRELAAARPAAPRARRRARRAEPADPRRSPPSAARHREHDARPGLALRRHGPPHRARRSTWSTLLPAARWSTPRADEPTPARGAARDRRQRRSPIAGATSAALQPAPVLDLLLTDETNPRSLAFQLRRARRARRAACRAPAARARAAPRSASRSPRSRACAWPTPTSSARARAATASARSSTTLLARLGAELRGALRRAHAAATSATPRPPRRHARRRRDELPRLAHHHVPLRGAGRRSCHNELRLTPRSGGPQHAAPHAARDRPDAVGAEPAARLLRQPGPLLHARRSRIDELTRDGRERRRACTPSRRRRRTTRRRGRRVRDRAARRTARPTALDAYQFVFESPHVRSDDALRRLRGAVVPGGPAAARGGARPHPPHPRRLRLRPRAPPSVATPVAEVLRDRRGVCQDFAHLEIACLRALGLAARYVSGYILTRSPRRDAERLVGADASHAWLAVYDPRRRLDRPRSDQRPAARATST